MHLNNQEEKSYMCTDSLSLSLVVCETEHRQRRSSIKSNTTAFLSKASGTQWSWRGRTWRKLNSAGRVEATMEATWEKKWRSLSLARTQAVRESVFESEHRRQRCRIKSSTLKLLPKEKGRRWSWSRRTWNQRDCGGRIIRQQLN